MSNKLNEEFHYIECRDVNLLLEEMRKYIHNETIIEEVRQAYLYAENKHEGQMRKSGDKFIIHPLSTAYYLAQWKMGPKTIIAGLLHDVIEDTPVTHEEIEQIFGTDVANIVESVTKVSFFTKENRAQMKAQYLRKLFISMIRDIRVIIVKIADRMHNMLTLKYMPPDKQKIIAKETLEIYSTIAHRIGMKTAKNLLEDWSFRYLNPEEYQRVSALLEEDIEAREQIIDEIISDIENKIKDSQKITKFEVYGRSKSFYSIYRKMTTFGKNFTDINDIIAVRIITENVDECYTVMGWVHQMYTPLSGRFKDYIATPKNNLYQSLHTTVANKDGIIFEVQIRTFNMEDIAMHGAAAHWKYKENEKNVSVEAKQKEIDEKVDMFTRIMNLEKLASEGEEVEYESGMDKLEAEIEETVKSDYLTSLIYVLTPDGQVVTLPFGSTVLDFAYKIHTEVGNHTVGAKINGVFSPFNTTLESGEMIEVQTSTEIEPQEKWLKFVRTSTAKKAIENFLADKSQKLSEKKLFQIKN
ncbi:RelA/SpoT family protein [Spiroplasma clarkii]|uniref:RelA/SpoT family protein n=1 Tax=Spiroplasma clarkii TaxID=2139 RepID=UPI0011BA7B8A|nr:RelA/SpoT family protein [Spiroplasma clarkii]